MINLDDIELFRRIDTEGMLSEIQGLPDQLLSAWKNGAELPLPKYQSIERVLIAGMGGSAIGADLLAAAVSPICLVPVFVHRDYDLPAWVHGSNTLVILSSHSGNTEETISAYKQAIRTGCTICSVSTGGTLKDLSIQYGTNLWSFEHRGQPRAAVGFSFGLLLSLFFRLGLIPDPGEELNKAVATMKVQMESIHPGVPVTQNLAKRIAGQLIDRWVCVIGAGLLSPVARRWKGQINELAKAWAQFEVLPETDHNTLAGILNPEKLFDRSITLFLVGSQNHARNQLRSKLTKKSFMLEGLNTEMIEAGGETRLEQMWSCLHLGDFIAYYLAMAYQVNPTPVQTIESFKNELKQHD